MSTQAQRARQRKKRDKEDSIAAAERADRCCERCGNVYAHCMANHHDYRKSTHPELRHAPRNHHYLCYECHRFCHDNVIEGHREMHAIRERRGDDLELHPSACNSGEND